MARNFHLAAAAANAAVQATAALLDGGTLVFYAGPQPSTANTPLAGNTALSTLRFGSPAFGAAAAGQAPANPIGSDPDVAASGDATFARGYQADRVSVVCDWSVGVSGCDINLDSATFEAGGTCALTALTLTLPQ